ADRIVVEIVGEGQLDREADRRVSRDGAKLGGQALDQGIALLLLLVADPRHRYAAREDVLGAETRVYGEQLRETQAKHARAREERERECELRGDQGVAQPVRCARRGAAPRLDGERLGQVAPQALP